MIRPMLRGNRDHFFEKKLFPKLNLLKSVSVTMIVNSEKIKIQRNCLFKENIKIQFRKIVKYSPQEETCQLHK